MDNLKKNFIDFNLQRVQNDLDEAIDLLLDLSIEPELNDLINLFKVIIDYRNLKKFIDRSEV